MGNRLRKLKSFTGNKKLSDGKTIGGKGRLTDAIISKLTTFYGNAIRANSHNNRRDQSQITHLSRQLYPRKVNFFQECYADATSKPYGYLLIDLKPEIDECLRVCTGMFPGDVFYVYEPR
ncbi:uncharacterized protein TNCV_4718101 [Trichonephila clavipes]|nr:uncharacterized protein TNCV_4718101 [Trichonephila clavipes]